VKNNNLTKLFCLVNILTRYVALNGETKVGSKSHAWAPLTHFASPGIGLAGQARTRRFSPTNHEVKDTCYRKDDVE